MSITPSLVLALLWFSLHACNARSFGVIPSNESEYSTSKKDKTLKTNIRVSIQPDMKSSILPNASGEVQNEREFNKNKAGTSRSNGTPEKPIEAHVKDDEVEGASVSWKVPHDKKRGDHDQPQVPEFNLDYLPPKTHPPVHN